MSKPRRDELYLGDIVEAIERIVAYLAGFSYEQFLEDTKVQDAVLRNLQIVGDASKKVSLTVRRAHPELPWRQMSGMRDKVVHEYFGLDYRIVWQVATMDLPRLLPIIRGIVEQMHAAR
jgi:uncharacterized protein with HEPN domain